MIDLSEHLVSIGHLLDVTFVYRSLFASRVRRVTPGYFILRNVPLPTPLKYWQPLLQILTCTLPVPQYHVTLELGGGVNTSYPLVLEVRTAVLIIYIHAS